MPKHCENVLSKDTALQKVCKIYFSRTRGLQKTLERYDSLGSELFFPPPTILLELDIDKRRIQSSAFLVKDSYSLNQWLKLFGIKAFS